MKILLLSNSNSEHTQKWAINLAQKGFEIGIFSFKKCESNVFKDQPNIKILYEPIEQKGHLRYVHKLNYLLLFSKLKKALREFHPDVLHAHYISSYGLLGALSGFKNFMASAWGSDVLSFPKKNFIFKSIVKFVLKKAVKITVTSEFLEKEIALYTSKQVKVIPFGTDLSVFKPVENTNRNFTFCSTKHLESIYNIDLIIKAFKLISDVHVNVKLKIAGGGTKELELRRLCDDLELSNKIEFVGRIPNSEMPALLNSSDVLINIPQSESFGVSVIEAMACKKGIIVSNIPAFENMIKDKKNGFKIDPLKIEVLFVAMEKYVLQKELVKQHGELNLKKVEAEFDLQIALTQMADVYELFNNLQTLPVQEDYITLERTA